MTKNINARQAGILIFLCVLANKFLLMPSLMFKDAHNDSVFSLIILFALDLLMLPVFFKLKKEYPDKKLFDILSSKITKFFTIVIYTIFAVYFFFKTLLTFSVVYVYLKQQVYQDEFVWIGIISVFPVINHAAVKGLRAFSRTIEFFFVVILIGFISCLSFSLFTQLTMPIFFTSTAKNFLLSLYKNIFSFGDFLILFIIIDKIKLKRGDEKIIYKYALLAMFLIVALFFLYFSKYQVTAFMHNNALSDILVFSVKFNAVGRLDIISMLTIMFLNLFQLEIFCYGFSESLTTIFPLMSKVIAVIIYDILFFLCYFVFIGKYENIITSFSVWLPIFAIFINYIFPLLCTALIIVNKFKNKKKLNI